MLSMRWTAARFELWTEVRRALGHHNGFVTQNALEGVKVAAGHHPVRSERLPQIVKVKL